MRMLFFFLLSIFVGAVNCKAEENTENVSPDSFVGIGVGLEHDLQDGSSVTGMTFEFEKDIIKDTLEAELGASLSRSQEAGTQLPIDLLFKMTHMLSPRFEFEYGLGPELARIWSDESSGNFWGIEAALELMFWPSPRYGFSLQSSYDFLFRNSGEQSVGMSVELLIGL